MRLPKNAVRAKSMRHVSQLATPHSVGVFRSRSRSGLRLMSWGKNHTIEHVLAHPDMNFVWTGTILSEDLTVRDSFEEEL